MSEDQEMREAIRARMEGRIRFNVAPDRIEVIVGEPDELLRWEPINRLTMLQHLPPPVVERLWDMFADAAGSGFYAEDRPAGVKFLGLHRVAEYLEEEECIRIEEITMPSRLCRILCGGTFSGHRETLIDHDCELASNSIPLAH